MSRHIPPPELGCVQDISTIERWNRCALLEQLEKLLEAHEQAGSFLHQESCEATQEFAVESLLNSIIGPYKLRERLGAGGMGVVWAAEQRLPLKRKVALKLIKPGMDSEQVIARFEAEREALSRMDHPHIARVLDAGTTEQGHPFFVMELIRGVPVTEYCDKKRLTIRQRLELFTKICSAVQHAHQKGIIHREIKPSNVLVSEQDGQPVPKVIDFGVAKALHQPLTDRSLYTGVFQALGTLQYMSPEQAGLSIADVDTRADVYGLGVLLYELLTGSTPFEKEQLASAAFDEACRIIREQEPPKPSTRLSTLGERALTISETRNTDPRQLSRLVRGDLDWIVTKSLDKDRNRRYESANSLAADVNRYLNSKPIEARPPSLRYRMKKLWQRNRALTSTVSTVVLALVAGSSVACYSLIRLSEEVAGHKKTISKLLESRAAEIIELALSGQRDQARRRQEDFKASIENPHENIQVRLNSAIIGMFGNDSEKLLAHEELKLLAKSNELATKALMIASYQNIGDEWNYFLSVGELKERNPASFEEFLFRGFAYRFGLPELAISDLECAVERRRTSGVAKVLLADALHLESLRNPDEKKRLLLAARAQEQAHFASGILPPDYPFLIASNINAITGQLVLAKEQLNVSHDKIETLVNLLELSTRIELYDWQLHTAQLDAIRILERKGISIPEHLRSFVAKLPETANMAPEVAIKLIEHHMRSGNLAECDRMCFQYEDLISGFQEPAFLPQLEFQHARGDNRELILNKAIQRTKNRNAANEQLGGSGDRVILRIIGEPELAKQRANAFRNFCESMQAVFPVAKQLIPVAERMAGISDLADSVILSQATIGDARHHTAYWLGIDALAERRYDDAKRLFEIAANEPAFHQFVSGWADIYLDRLKDPEWLSWVAKGQHNSEN